ncbi:tRNA1(Val) (adenine(37)-N6)-methyltransferase [Haloimpatiens massiliensis]|uniref:tRNA1(Val) (adenine(37)-N6)-methyltransferase n=1 Tax=Haloimpatiens massiliensis TaxID=1658110 RepID=UPI000C83CDF5|nr:tRNA1(Val) (adenine(37)-N6)-methyltransferase [Haloimpatiens massiliensis]
MDMVREDETLDDLQLGGLCVIQKKEGFRFGVDAVLLANFSKVKSRDRVIDLCSGTGVIPFIIEGKRNPQYICGVEIQQDMVEMAKRSISYNKLEEKMEFINGDLKDNELLKNLGRFNVVTVNPPYKLKNSGITNLRDKDAIARHEILCTLEDVIKACRNLLKDNGRMYMVHRPDRLVDIVTLMRKYKIEPKRIRMVHPSVGKAPNIVLVEGQRDGGKFLKWDEPLYVHNEDGSYTEEIEKIYGRIK